MDKLVLIAENDESEAVLLQAALRRSPGRVDYSIIEDGEGVVAYLEGVGPGERQKPSLLVTDLKMLGMDGFDLLSWVRSNSRWSNLPVVVLSSSNEPADVEKARKLGADAYYVKPQSFDQLQMLISTLKRDFLQNT